MQNTYITVNGFHRGKDAAEVNMEGAPQGFGDFMGTPSASGGLGLRVMAYLGAVS